jgi:tol-pal system beta propeller repeat protein TolB
MDANGEKQRRVASHIVAKSTRSWSPDGRRIVLSATEANNVDIYAIDVRSGRSTRLTTAPGDDRDPSWSPDGTRVAFSSNRDGTPQVYVMDANGRNQRRLTSDASPALVPRWSPDGSMIAFAAGDDAGRDLYVISSTGGVPRRLTAGALVTKDSPQWSPDGSRIAFQIADGKNYDIGVVRLDLSAHPVSRLADSNAYDGSYTWSPDGQHLAFISARDGFDGVYVVDAEGGHVDRLTDSASLTPAWGPQR